MLWIEFLICSFSLVFCAFNLCREGVIISEKTDIEKGLIGMLFLAVATSAPEIITAASAVRLMGNVHLGYGDIVGSVMINLMIFPLLHFTQKNKGDVLIKASAGNIRTGEAALFACSVMFFSIFLRRAGVPIPVIGGRFGIENIPILLSYFWTVTMFMGTEGEEKIDIYPPTETLFQVWSKFALFLIAVLGLSIWLSVIGHKIGQQEYMSQTFTGTFFLGLITSFPEIIVTFAAIRVGAAEMAIGNILGSNLFDICVIPLLDVLVSGPILGMIGPGGTIAAGTVFTLSLVALSGMRLKRISERCPDCISYLIFIVGLGGFVLVYLFK